MVRTEKVVVVFVASPTDVEDERNKCEEVIRELNTTWSRELGVRLDLIRWETHAFPGVGPDAQEVINRQLPHDYDIFVGIMWGRYGSPTNRAESGTEEEFLRAWARHEAGEDIHIMFYFKDAPIAPSKLDPDQLAKIQSFKSKIGSEGALYWSFQTLDEFASLLRLHLARKIQTLEAAMDASKAAPTADRPDADARESEEDAGLLDLMEKFEERFQIVIEIVDRISSATEDLGTKITARASAINDAVGNAGGGLPRSEAKRLMNRAADDMDALVARAGAEIPILREAMKEGIDALGQATALAAALNQVDPTQAGERRAAVKALETSLESAYKSMEAFRGTVHGLPRMTTTLNAAKRKTVRVLDELLQAFADGRRFSREAEKAIDAVLGAGPNA